MSTNEVRVDLSTMYEIGASISRMEAEIKALCSKLKKSETANRMKNGVVLRLHQEKKELQSTCEEAKAQVKALLMKQELLLKRLLYLTPFEEAAKQKSKLDIDE